MPEVNGYEIGPEADLHGADLSGANLSGAGTSEIYWDRSTVWPDGFTPLEPSAE